MVLLAIINKGGSCKNVEIKNMKEDELYKKCNFRKEGDFCKKHTWTVNDTAVSVFAKENGRAGTENKYEFPPPLDTTLFYGNVALVGYKDGNAIDLPVEKWQNIYEELMGGFDDLDEEIDEDSEDDIDPENITDTGYEKDGFVVEDNDVDSEKSEDSDEESEWVDSDDSQLTEEEYDEN